MARGRRRVLSFVGWFWSDRSVVACDFAPFPECLSALLFALADCDYEQRCALFYDTVRAPRGWDRILEF